MPTIAAQRASEKIEADIVLARSLYLAADAAVNTAGLARFAAAAAADKALAAANAHNGNTADIDACFATNIAAEKSFEAYDEAYDEAEIASTRLQALCDKLAALQAR